MPDELDPTHTDAGQTDAVRRLLADARETGPMPPEVAARLDAVLADLAAGGEPASVTPLRRRRWPRVVLAAAAVTAVALGATELVDRGSPAGDDQRADTASEAGERATLDEAPRITADRQPDGQADGQADGEPEEQAGRGTASAPEPGTLRDAGKDRSELSGNSAPVTLPGLDRALQDQGLAPVGRLHEVDGQRRLSALLGTAANSFSENAYAAVGRRCGPLYDVADGSAYLALARPGTLVLAHPPANGIRLVEVYDCTGEEPRRSTSVVTLTVPE